MIAARLLVLLSVAVTGGDAARDEAVKKQRDAAAEQLKAAKLTPAEVETNDLLVYAALPAERAKGMAAAMQKTHDAARKVLKVDPKNPLWAGKLTAYLLPDPKQFRGLMLQVVKRAPRTRETYIIDQRGDAPLIVSGAAPGERLTDARLTADASAMVAAAVLGRVIGTSATPPQWLLGGFGRAAYLHAEGNAEKLAAHKSKVRGIYTRTRGQAFKVTAVWEEQPGVDPETVATSLVEFLAYGPPAEKFPAFVAAFKPTDTDPNPRTEAAVAAAGWKPDDLEAAWKKWVQTGK